MCATTLKDLCLFNNFKRSLCVQQLVKRGVDVWCTSPSIHLPINARRCAFSWLFEYFINTPLKKAIFAMPLIWIYYPNLQGACHVWKASFHWHLTKCVEAWSLLLCIWYCAAAHDIRIVGWLAQLLCNNTDWANVNHACVSSTLNFELDQLYRTDSDFLEVINI